MSRLNPFLLFAMVVGIIVVGAILTPSFAVANDSFTRGDYNQDGFLDVSDPVMLLGYLAQSESPETCLDAGDVNDDGTINIGDVMFLLYYVYIPGFPPPPEPLSCGDDLTPDSLDCVFFESCP